MPVETEKWIQDAAREVCPGCRKELPESRGEHLWPDSHYTRCVRDLTAAIIARHFSSREKQGWIACSERLPEIGKLVVIYAPSAYHWPVITMAKLNQDGDEFDTCDDSFGADEVTHWRPLPAAPSAKESQ
jgi:Protein of unknown function (DUF551)